MDGVPGIGAGQSSSPARSTVYEFDAEPFGLHLYHCHVAPLAEHIAKGLYGAFIIDPKEGRAEADELVMVMNGFDTNFDRSQRGLRRQHASRFHYMNEPIEVKRGELVRIYLVNVLEFDPINSFHVHAQLLQLLPDRHARSSRASSPTPSIQGQGQRGILELRFPYAGQVHVPRPRDRVRRARLDGLLRGRRS